MTKVVYNFVKNYLNFVFSPLSFNYAKYVPLDTFNCLSKYSFQSELILEVTLSKINFINLPLSRQKTKEEKINDFPLLSKHPNYPNQTGTKI